MTRPVGTSKRGGAMTTALNKDDWQRILHALSHFLHNTEYRETHGKVARILGNLDP